MVDYLGAWSFYCVNGSTLHQAPIRFRLTSADCAPGCTLGVVTCASFSQTGLLLCHFCTRMVRTLHRLTSIVPPCAQTARLQCWGYWWRERGGCCAALPPAICARSRGCSARPCFRRPPRARRCWTASSALSPLATPRASPASTSACRCVKFIGLGRCRSAPILGC